MNEYREDGKLSDEVIAQLDEMSYEDIFDLDARGSTCSS